MHSIFYPHTANSALTIILSCPAMRTLATRQHGNLYHLYHSSHTTWRWHESKFQVLSQATGTALYCDRSSKCVIPSHQELLQQAQNTILLLQMRLTSESKVKVQVGQSLTSQVLISIWLRRGGRGSFNIHLEFCFWQPVRPIFTLVLALFGSPPTLDQTCQLVTNVFSVCYLAYGWFLELFAENSCLLLPKTESEPKQESCMLKRAESYYKAPQSRGELQSWVIFSARCDSFLIHMLSCDPLLT